MQNYIFTKALLNYINIIYEGVGQLLIIMKQTIIFTDLDGTLIDHDTYRFDEAETTLKKLKEETVPVIICSSKTRAEIEVYHTSIGLDDPFISENGGAIFIPQDTIDSQADGFVKKGSYLVMELGKPYGVLRKAWTRIKAKEGFQMTGFSEMTIEQIVKHTGLPTAHARLAAMREYSEPFLFFEKPERLQFFKKVLREQGLQITKGGRFYHLTGSNDKGRAVEILRKLYARKHPGTSLFTIGLGDSANDIPMLENVDLPVMIRKKTGQWEILKGKDSVMYSDKAGPAGWAESINHICWVDAACS